MTSKYYASEIFVARPVLKCVSLWLLLCVWVCTNMKYQCVKKWD